MATQQQFDTILAQVNERLEKMLSYSIEELTREEALGTQFSFKELEEKFVKIIDLFKRVNEVNLKEVPYNLLNAFNGQINSAITYFDQAKNFNAAVNNSVATRNSLITNINNSYDNYYTHSIPILSIGLLNSNDLSLERSKMNQLIADLIYWNSRRITGVHMKWLWLQEGYSRSKSCFLNHLMRNHCWPWRLK